MTPGALFGIPFWAFGLFFLLVLLVSLEIGGYLGLKKHATSQGDDSEEAKSLPSSILLLLGLILAFSFGAGVSRYEARKAALNEEANVLSTVYLRADFAPEPERTELKKVLFEYTKMRTMKQGKEPSLKMIHKHLQKAEELHAKLWDITKQIVEKNNQYKSYESSLVNSMIQVFDSHTHRVAVVLDKMPVAVILLQLIIAAVVLMVSGYNAGIDGKFDRWRMYALTVVLVAVMLAIQDFDRSIDGFIRVNHANIVNLIDSMEADLSK